MAETHETIADLVAWLRRPREGENAYLTAWRDEIADRLEAAWKRERAKIEADALEVGGIVEAAHRRERNRNFHRFATAEEAAKAWHKHEANDTGEKYCAGCPFNLGEDCARGSVCTIGWLYAEAQEGGANG